MPVSDQPAAGMTPPFRYPLRVAHLARAWPLLCLLPLAMAGCSEDVPAKSALITTVPDASWNACSSDSACEARWLPCRGWQAVNREHGQQVEAWYARANSAYLSRADCDGRPLHPPAVFCRARQCSLE